MPQTNWQRLVRLFEQLVTHSPASRRQRLAELEGTDADLRSALERLLAGHDRSTGILERRELIEELAAESKRQPTIAMDAPSAAAPSVGVGSTIGPYRLEEVLGQGGMGVVYRARQEFPIRRDVALKLIKVGLGGRELEARFQVERQALAAMDHPSIARVYEAGTTPQGQPYFVMELASGSPVTTYCDHHRLTLRERLELFAELCDAVQHAHRRGVIHRDLKPSNVLVGEVDGRPVPKVIDFGVAKATDPALIVETLTHDRRLIGTPAYMSPEQWEAKGDIDTRTDVYSLSVLLYRLLVGAMPLEHRDEEGLVGFVRRLSSEEPPSPSARLSSIDNLEEVATQRRLDAGSLRRALRGELEWIAAKGMARSRDERYGSAAELGADVRRYLRGEAIAARPDRLYRMRKLGYRHRGALLATAAVLLVLVAGLVATSLALIESRRSRAMAEEESAVAEAVNRFLNDDLLAAARVENSGGREVTVREIVDRAHEGLASFEGPPAVEARVRRSLANVYHSLADYPTARELLGEAHRLNLEHLGREHAATIASGLELGMMERYGEGPGNAEAILLDTLVAAREVLGAEHPDTIRGWTYLANLYTSQGRLDEAIALHTSNLERWEQIDDAAKLNVANAKSNLATALTQRGDYEEAIRQRRFVLELFTGALGPDHVNTLRATGLLGSAYQAADRFEEAEPLLRRALEGLRGALGSDHPHTLVETLNLAGTLSRLKRYEEAEGLARAAAAGMRTALGAGNVNSLAALRNLGTILDLQGRSAEAEAILSEAVALARQHLPEGHWYLGAFLGAHGRCLINLGRFAEAEAALVEGVGILEPVVDPGHKQLVEVRASLARLYDVWRPPEAARRYRQRSDGHSPPTFSAAAALATTSPN